MSAVPNPDGFPAWMQPGVLVLRKTGWAAYKIVRLRVLRGLTRTVPVIELAHSPHSEAQGALNYCLRPWALVPFSFTHVPEATRRTKSLPSEQTLPVKDKWPTAKLDPDTGLHVVPGLHGVVTAEPPDWWAPLNPETVLDAAERDYQTRHKNVYWNEGRARWQVQVTMGGGMVNGGCFDSIEQAVETRDALRKEHGLKPITNPRPKLPHRGPGTSGVRAVYPQNGKWIVRIKIDGKLRQVGYFATVEAAIAARDRAEAERDGLLPDW